MFFKTEIDLFRTFLKCNYGEKSEKNLKINNLKLLGKQNTTAIIQFYFKN